jgi:spore coat polysaccharide biosynthesis protein SpsF
MNAAGIAPVICITQARIGSTRLPGKVLLPILGRPLLWWHLARLKLACRLDRVVVATTDEPGSEGIVAVAEDLGIPVVRGSTEDVLARFQGVVEGFAAATVVRVTSDCPLIDPGLIDRAIERYEAAEPRLDYLSIDIARLPRGFDAEIFSRAAFDTAFREATDLADREHVSRFIWRQPERFAVAHYADEGARHGAFRLCVDEAADFDLVGRVIEALAPGGLDFGWRAVVDLLEARPDWQALNAHIRQKNG